MERKIRSMVGMIDYDIKDIFGKCDAYFSEIKKMPKELTIEIEFCSSTDELYKRRCILTRNPIAKANLEENAEKYKNANGCYIIPPEDYHFVMLLKSSNVFFEAYDYLHELTHICNYMDYLNSTKCDDYFKPFQNHAFYLWDEYNARYISTCALIEYLESCCEREDISETITKICKCLRNCCEAENIKSYDGSQLLGAVEAAHKYDYIKNIEEYLCQDEIAILEEYSSIDDASFFTE